MNLAVRDVKNGLIGNVPQKMFHKSILSGLHRLIGGNQPKLEAMAARLVQLMISGMMLVEVVESYKEGMEGGDRFAKIYDRELREVQNSVMTEIQRCVDNFQVNLEKDLREELMMVDKNKERAARLMKTIDAKYDFEEMVVLIYDDIVGFDKHTIEGHRIDILPLSGKSGLVFSDSRDQCNPQMPSALGLVSNVAHGISDR